MDKMTAQSATPFSVVSTAGFDGESALRRFRRWTVADVSARFMSQVLGETVTLLEAPFPLDRGSSARDRLVPTGVAVLDSVSATRLASADGRLTLIGDDLLEAVLHANEGSSWSERVLAAQRVAIGGSRGALVRFVRTDGGGDIPVFTTRPDTLFGATFVAVPPAHPVAKQANQELMDQFRAECHRSATVATGKVGVPLGLSVEHPFKPGQTLPVWLVNFLVEGYGTGAAGGCPACDQRDLDFARRYRLPVVPIICPPGQDPVTYQTGASAHTGDGTMINSGFLNGLTVKQAIDAATRRLEESGRGRATVQYRRKPLVVAEETLEGRADVHRLDRWWRFTDSFLAAAPYVASSASNRRTAHVLHVTTPETATGHLLDARILWRALPPTRPLAPPEPWEDVVLVGDVSQSPEGPILPDPLRSGDDALRVTVLADVPPDRDSNLSVGRHEAAVKLIERAKALFSGSDGEIDVADLPRLMSAAAKMEKALRQHKTNTAIAAAHEIIAEAAGATQAGLATATRSLVAALLYALLPESVEPALAAGCRSAGAPPWPQIGQQSPESGAVEIMVQISGKKRGTVQVARDADEEAVLAAIRADTALNARLTASPIRRTIFVPNKLVNLVL